MTGEDGFTCENCGSHERYVGHYYETVHGDRRTLYVRRAGLDSESADENRPEDWDEPEVVEELKEELPEGDEGSKTEEVDEDSEEFYVFCAGCDRELGQLVSS